MKATSATTKASVRAPAVTELKAKKDALERGERTPSRVFPIEKKPDGTFSRVAVNPDTQRHKSAKAWETKSEVVKVRQALDLTQEAFADLLGIGLGTHRNWGQKKRESSGAARMLIAIALKHPEVRKEVVA